MASYKDIAIHYNERMIDNIAKYQLSAMCGYWHGLTCVYSNCKQFLYGDIINQKVKLKCPDCNYVQDYIPPNIVFVDNFKNNLEPFRKNMGYEKTNMEEHVTHPILYKKFKHLFDLDWY